MVIDSGARAGASNDRRWRRVHCDGLDGVSGDRRVTCDLFLLRDAAFFRRALVGCSVAGGAGAWGWLYATGAPAVLCWKKRPPRSRWVGSAGLVLFVAPYMQP